MSERTKNNMPAISFLKMATQIDCQAKMNSCLFFQIENLFSLIVVNIKAMLVLCSVNDCNYDILSAIVWGSKK